VVDAVERQIERVVPGAQKPRVKDVNGARVDDANGLPQFRTGDGDVAPLATDLRKQQRRYQRRRLGESRYFRETVEKNEGRYFWWKREYWVNNRV
jgi:hypothetical protein